MLLQPGVGLDLVHRGHNLGRLEHLLRLLNVEVADADAPDLARGDELLHGRPGVGDGHLLLQEEVGLGVLGEQLVALVDEADGPVDLIVISSAAGLPRRRGLTYEVQVEVVSLQVLEGLVQGRLDVVGVVVVVP